MLDFNDADDQQPDDNPTLSKAFLKKQLLDRLPTVLNYLFPNGKMKADRFRVGDLDGNAGESLCFALQGDEAGTFFDHAKEDDRGDIFTAWAHVHHINKSDFKAVLESVSQWLGETIHQPTYSVAPTSQAPQEHAEDLGMHTAKYDYWSAEKKLYAVVYRYDTPTGKQFRPYDVTSRQFKAPSPRILYNLPQVQNAHRVIIVEGEKCVNALSALDIVATTAMFGSKAPLEKTDWTPLKDKEVIIWPDKDKAGWEYAERVSKYLVSQGITTDVKIIYPPDDKTMKWDAADAVTEGMDVESWLFNTNNYFTQEDDPSQSPYKLTAIDPPNDWVGVPPEREWIVPGWLPKGYVTALYGDGGVGKSLLAQQLVTSLATGTGWLDIPLKQQKVYALLCEDDSNELWRRQYNINHHYGINMSDLDQVRMVSRVGENNILMEFDYHDVGAVTDFFEVLEEDIASFGADVILLDTLADLFSGNENNRTQVRQFVQNCCARLARNTGGAVLLCAHPSDAGIHRKTGTGGSTAWSNTVRSRWYLQDVKDKNAGPNERILSRKKSNYSSSGDHINLVWKDHVLHRIYIDTDEDDITKSEVKEKNVDEKRQAKQAERRQTVLQLIRDEAQGGRLYTNSQFAQKFQNTHGLGGFTSTKDLLSAMATQGHIAFVRDAEPYGLTNPRRANGFLCLDGMPLIPKTSEKACEDESEPINIKATHRIDPCSGEMVEIDEIENVSDMTGFNEASFLIDDDSTELTDANEEYYEDDDNNNEHN